MQVLGRGLLNHATLGGNDAYQSGRRNIEYRIESRQLGSYRLAGNSQQLIGMHMLHQPEQVSGTNHTQCRTKATCSQCTGIAMGQQMLQ